MTIKPIATPKSHGRGRTVIWLLLIFIVPVLTSCTKEPEPLLRVATNVWPGYELLYLARSLGFYDASPIRLVEMPSSSQSLHALSNGTVEAAALTLDEALNLLQDSAEDWRVILVMDISDGADVLLASTDIASLADLRGKRIGVENTATGAVVLDAALESAGLKSDDIRIVPKTVDEHLSAWNNHELDAVVTFEPVRSQLLQAGAHEVFNSSQVPERILDVLVVHASALERNKTTLKTLVAGYFAAREHWLQQVEDAAMRMSPRLKANIKQVMAQFNDIKLPDQVENRQWLSGTAPKLRQSAFDLAALMRQRRLLEYDVVVDTIAEPGFLPETAP